MKPIAKQSNKKAGFTIVELLTVMSIIIILMGLLAPAMNRARRFARKVAQKNQFHSIDVALEMFRAEFDGYPPSDYETTTDEYCGATKLAEAMVGQDLLGFHPDSRFRADGTVDGTTATQLYTPATETARIDPYIPLESTNAYRLGNLWWDPVTLAPKTDNFNPLAFVLCDVYTRVQNLETGKRVGMPILYYKANTSNSLHDVTMPGNSIYNYLDNHEFVKLGMPWNLPPGGPMHDLFHDPDGEDNVSSTPDDEAEGEKVYIKTRNKKITTIIRPYRADSFILISAGYDGEYGTQDDVFNFED